MPEADHCLLEHPNPNPAFGIPRTLAQNVLESTTMKRNRIHFENGDASSASPPAAAFTPSDDRQSAQHVPKISRRIRACTECKRHKVRCDMKAGESTCSRCRRMKLECVVNKSLQTLLEDEAE
jgi:hypothetical protein